MLLGPVLSLVLLSITTFIAYITATFVIEAVSVAHALDDKARRFSMFGHEAYKSPIVHRKVNLTDLDNKQSAFYIRQKIELGVVSERLAKPWVKTTLLIILTIYMYGAICLKFVSGAESFVAGIALTFWDNEDAFNEWIGFDPYYLGLFVFGFFSLFFSFGNIENAKTLQIVTTILRFVVTILMCCGSIYYLAESG